MVQGVSYILRVLLGCLGGQRWGRWRPSFFLFLFGRFGFGRDLLGELACCRRIAFPRLFLVPEVVEADVLRSGGLFSVSASLAASAVAYCVYLSAFHFVDGPSLALPCSALLWQTQSAHLLGPGRLTGF